MVFNFDKYSIDLGDINFDSKNFKMETNTSYAEKFIKKYKHSKVYREQLLPLKLQCLLNIKEYIGDNYYNYLDLLAGLGITGKIFNTLPNGLQYNVWNEIAPDCVEILKRNLNENILIAECDMFTAFDTQFKAPIDFIFADFNNFTLKRYLTLYKPVLDNIFNTAQKYVLINDCSIFFLRYGKKSYDVYRKLLNADIKDSDFLQFYAAIVDFYAKEYPGWRITRIEAFKDTSFMLFEKTESENYNLNINYPEHIKVKTILADDVFNNW